MDDDFKPNFDKLSLSLDANVSSSSYNSLQKDADQIAGLITINQIYLDFVSKLIDKVDRSIEKNRDFQNAIKTQLNSKKKMEEFPKNIISTATYYPPYFKDSAGMTSKLNIEAKEIQKICKANPLSTEDRPWKETDLNFLKKCVRDSIYYNSIISLNSRKEILIEKTSQYKNKEEWREEIEKINRRILFLRERPDSEIFVSSNYENVDWIKISVTNFNNLRTAIQLRLKWCNEEAPIFNKSEWTNEEDNKLKALKKQPWQNWDVIADQLGTSRSAYSCFQRFKHLEIKERGKRIWRLEEDEKLESLVQTLRVGDEIPWTKISTYLPGRSKEMCQSRFIRSLSDNIKHGRWTITEDLILLNSINKYGPQDWQRISYFVQTRSAVQCRDRWINVLDYKRRNKPWLWEEYERLFFGIRFFGRNNCAKIALLLPGRNNMDVKQRIFSLIRFKIAKFEEGIGSKKVEYRNVGASYNFKKDRREMVLSKFRQFTEVIYCDNNSSSKLDSRMGMGSFMLTNEGNPFLANSKKSVEYQFGKIITRCGRWIGISRNPNEYDNKELEEELKKLSSAKRREMKTFLAESNIKYNAECKEEESNSENSIEFYQNIITPERKERLIELIDELLPTENKHFLRYSKTKTKAPRLTFLEKERLKSHKNVISESQRKSIKRKSNLLLDKNIATKRFLTIKDRLLQEVKEKIFSVEPSDRRLCVIRNLCTYIRRCDDLTNVEIYRKKLKNKSLDLGMRHLANILNIELNSTIENSKNKELDILKFSLKDSLKLLLPPCVATLNAAVSYRNRTRQVLVKNAGRLFDAVNDSDYSHVRFSMDDDCLDIRISNDIKNSNDYIQLKKRMYQMFLLPFIMQASLRKSEELEEIRNKKELIYRRHSAERSFIESVTEKLGSIDLSSVKTNVFKVYNNNNLTVSKENDFDFGNNL